MVNCMGAGSRGCAETDYGQNLMRKMMRTRRSHFETVRRKRAFAG